MDKLIHPNYTEDMNWYPDKPFELKHVYDTLKDDYTINELQCCYFCPVENHKYCNHKQNCILNDERWEYYDENLHEIVVEIKEIRKLIKEYENIYQNLLNNEIIFHKNLEECYTITKKKVDGKCVIEVSVSDNFKNVLKLKINNLKVELRDWNRELLRIKRK